MENSISFESSINKSNIKNSVEDWNVALDNYEKGNSFAAISSLLRYLDSTRNITVDANSDLKFPHGSIVVNFKISDGKIKITAPFLKLPEGGSQVAITRQIVELNFSYLVLAQIVLRGNELYLEYEDKVEYCEPFKLYYIMEEICFCADYYDDLFIEKFKAVRVREPEVVHLNSGELDKAYEVYKKIINDAVSAANYLEPKRNYGTLLNALAVTFLKLDYVLAPQGTLSNDINEGLNYLYANEPWENIITNSRKKLQKLLDYDKNKFNEFLFYPKFLVHPKKRADLNFTQGFLENMYNSTGDKLASKNYMDAAIDLNFIYYDLFFRYRVVPDELETFIESTLKDAGGKDWKTAAEILYRNLDKIMKLEASDEASKSLLSSSSQKKVEEKKSESTISNITSGISTAKSIFGKLKGLFD